jgi:hypothetical protein
MTLRETIARHAANVLNRSDHFGESVTYTPNGGSPITLRAVVDRRDIEPTEATARVARHSAYVFLPTSGLTDYPQAGDRITLAITLGASATSCRVTNVIEEDEGGVMVEVQS